ncbi:MAG: tRNA guanosine(34) transglycosylase Tgt [Acholeplasmataceae bacterium]|nr:tRNA guanosine(34) transglycosylase Tgt [Acholeplasmataceae bacterium]
MAIKFEVKHTCSQSGARYGILQIGEQQFETPMFMPVGTNATVKTLSVEELKQVSDGLILANTYHLWLEPGPEVIELHGGVKNFMNWDGALLTDSGGFQVFSLSSLRKITEQGVHFTNPINGDKLFLSPEKAIEIQNILGADIMMSFDECPPIDLPKTQLKESIERTLRWAKRGKNSHQTEQALFGIVQGGLDLELREYSALKTIEIGFPGYAIGGLSVGETKQEMYEVVKFLKPILPQDKPRYLMGVGTPDDIINSVIHGIDMFDCVLPTRNARHGQAMTTSGKIQIRNKIYQTDLSPLDPGLDTHVNNYSKSYLRHLFRQKEILGMRLLSYQNLAFLKDFMAKIRQAILENRLLDFKKEFYQKYYFKK